MAGVTLPAFVALDTNCFVYLFEPNDGSRRDRLLHEVFDPMRTGARRSVTSTLTLAELLVRPIAQGEPDLATELRTAMLGLPGLVVAPVDAEIAGLAAEIRGKSGMRLPDAVHLATGVVRGADAFVTNDRELLRGGAWIDVRILDDLPAAG